MPPGQMKEGRLDIVEESSETQRKFPLLSAKVLLSVDSLIRLSVCVQMFKSARLGIIEGPSWLHSYLSPGLLARPRHRRPGCSGRSWCQARTGAEVVI